MAKNIKLKSKELFYFIIVTFPPLLLLFVPNYAAIYAGLDSWAIFIFIAVIDIIFGYIVARMGQMAPELTAVGMSRYVFGNAMGSVFGALFVILFGLKSMMFFRQSLEYVFMSTYTLEPIYYFAIPMMLVLVYGQICGTKAMVRLSNIVFWLMSTTYFLLMLSAVRNFDLHNMMPFFIDGTDTVVKGVPHFFTWCGNSVILLMIFNKTNVKRNTTSYIMAALGIAYGVIIALNVLFVGVFGVISGFITTSVLELSLFLSKQVFFNNFDSVVKLIWIFGAFIRDNVFISCTANAVSELIGTRQNKLIKLLVPFILTVPPIILFRNEETYFTAGMGISSAISGAVQYGAVLILYIGLIIKRRASVKREVAV